MGVRDGLTRYTHPLTGAYYFVPSIEDIQRTGRRPDSPPRRRS
jgi:deferrochelatase/peroxidase EfeB